jgi:hypothetical protein
LLLVFFSDFKIYYVGVSIGVTPLSYQTVRTYLVTISCRDDPQNGATTGSTLIEIDILPNEAPVITNYPAGTGGGGGGGGGDGGGNDDDDEDDEEEEEEEEEEDNDAAAAHDDVDG